MLRNNNTLSAHQRLAAPSRTRLLPTTLIGLLRSRAAREYSVRNRARALPAQVVVAETHE